MKSKLPVLIIIPHGGQLVPDELSGYEHIDRFGIFIESDSCANQLFDFKKAAAKIDTHISRLFVDADRSPLDLPPRPGDHVMKKESQGGKAVFCENTFPHEIAISNILRRYHRPFHDAVKKIISSGEIKLILECHTIMPVGPRNSPDAGKPRPIINVENIAHLQNNSTRTCPDRVARAFLKEFSKPFNNENYTVANRLSLNNPKFSGYTMGKHGTGSIPMLKLSVSRALFLNDKYFNYDYLTVDEARIVELKKKLWSGIAGFVGKFLL